jgi:hypothetical protein
MKRWFASLLLTVAAANAADGATPVSFQREILPLLSERCQMCHQGEDPAGKLALTSYQSLLKGGQSGSVIKPGEPNESLLVQVISGEKPRMPKAGLPLTSSEVALIRLWVEQEAKDESSGRTSTGQGTWWSLRPLVGQPIPPAGSDWVQTTIDAFVLEKLRQKGLTPSPEADKRTLIRRLSLDLCGLPPTPEELDAFLADRAPDAYERLVDRLLASPRYGERWARHWLDIVHYGDSHGYDKDKRRLNAWPYRDYVIRSLNDNKPYDRFAQEQIAGDVHFPEDAVGVIATGFIAAGPWDFVGHMELREGTTDKEIARVLDRDDMVTATISTFVSLTVHCARCHDHKFDPIKQEDYYSLQAVFAGVDRADRPFDEDPQVHRQRQMLLQKKREIQVELQPLLDKVEQVKSPEIVQIDNRLQDLGGELGTLTTTKNEEEVLRKKQLKSEVEQAVKKRKELVDAQVDLTTRSAIDLLTNRIAVVEQQIQQLGKPQLVYAAANFFPRDQNFRPALLPRPIHLLVRGNVQTPGKLVTPGAISCVETLPSRFNLEDPNDEGKRRAALANWVTDPSNMLTWRSIVNRAWQNHFGTGIVDTPNDFGRMGSLPTHPELLDWLALWFQHTGHYSIKNLDRLIVTSAVYRQSSAYRLEAARIDSDNRELWRMNRTRLDAESIHDSILQVSGKLDLRMGGPGVQQFYFKDDHSPVYDYSRFDVDSPDSYRRSVYRFLVRSVADPFMDRLDCPNASLLTPKRTTTLTAIQALALLNNPFMVRMSQHFAERIKSLANPIPDQIACAYRLALGREPTTQESQAFSDYSSKYGLENACRLIFNSNEFLFVD